ncbi:MAG: GGDEF domain-containing protein [Gammaproteobacteria bacterium]
MHSRSSDTRVASSPSGQPPQSVEEQPMTLAAGLYALWAAVAALASVLGAAPLSGGAAVILLLGAGLSVGLFLLVDRLPEAEKPSGAMLIAGQSLMGIVWTTLYLWFAGGSGTSLVLGVGMMVSAIALAMTAVAPGVLARLMLIAAGAMTASILLKQLTLIGSDAFSANTPAGAVVAELLPALLPVSVLAIALAVLYRLAWHLQRTSNRLRATNTELQQELALLRHQAERDFLTNSYSRRSILEMVGRERARADRSGDSMCICLLDIDHFKNMNDRYGHQAGDRLLAAFARRVRGALRSMDTLNSSGLPAIGHGEAEDLHDDVRSALGRVGGEEFIVLLPETSMRGALKCAERMRKAVVQRPFEGLHPVTVSIGIAEYRPGESVSDLIERADRALYAAKNAGRNRVHCATADGGASAIIMPDLRQGSGT